jgi:hypothetical protein
MASRDTYPVTTFTDQTVDIVGSFQPNGNLAAPIAIQGIGFTVVNGGGAGLYTVTLQDNWPVILAITADIACNSLTALKVQAGAQSLVAQTNYNQSTIANKLSFPLTIFNTTSGAATDPVSNVNTRVSFIVCVKRLSAKVY